MEDKKIIAEMNFKNIDFREQAIDDYFNCILCGSELVYTHLTDFVYLDVQETAQCPHCKVQTKAQSHKLQ